MKKIFRSRLPAPLSADELNNLKQRSNLTTEDIEEWYERFNHCYPCGYLSLKEFIYYLTQFHMNNKKNHVPTQSTAKELFKKLDLNEDKRLDFKEFFHFHLLINHGPLEEKLKLILTLYDGNKDKYLTRGELEDFLINMFHLLNISHPVNGLSAAIENILTTSNFNTGDTKISWQRFSSYVLQSSDLSQTLLSGNVGETCDILTTRF